MANTIFTRFLYQLATGADGGWEDAAFVVYAMLERSTSEYSVNKDHDFVSDLGSFVEISVSSYAQERLTNKAVNIDDANDRIELDCDDLTFGTLESGQTVKSIILYNETNATGTSSDDPLICRIDTDSGAQLPVALGGGAFTVTIDAEGLFQHSQP